MCKVETKSVCIYKRSCLLYMASKYCTKCFLKQMCCTVVSFCKCTVLCINFKSCYVTDLDHSFYNMSNMSNLCSCKVNTIFYNKLSVGCTDHTLVSFLSTHCCIEWSLLNDDCSLLSVRKCINNLCLCCKSCDLRIKCQIIISNKFCLKCCIQLIVYRNLFSCIRMSSECSF